MTYVISALGFEISPDLQEQLDVLRNERIDYIEFRGADNRWLLDFNESEIRKIGRQIQRNDLRVSSVASPVGKTSVMDAFNIADLKRSLEYASILQSPNLRIFSFFVPKGVDPNTYRDEIFGRLEDMVTVASDYPVKLCHENETGTFGETPERSLDIYGEFPSMRAVFDPANFVRSGCDPLRCLISMRDFVEYFHIKDMSIESGKYVVAGEGDAKLKQILSEMKKEERVIFLSLEPSLGDYVQGKRELTGPNRFRQHSASLRKILSEI